MISVFEIMAVTTQNQFLINTNPHAKIDVFVKFVLVKEMFSPPPPTSCKTPRVKQLNYIYAFTAVTLKVLTDKFYS